MGLIPPASDASAMPPSPRYRLRGAPPRLRDLGDEVAAFNQTTWDTHVLDAAAVHVLDALREGPADREAIAARLATAAGTSAAEALPFAGRLLDELDAAGLIEPCPDAHAG